MMTTAKWFSPKDPTDTETYTFGFDADLNVGETIVTSNWSISLVEGVDSSPSTMLTGGPTVVSPKASHFIQGGIDGNVYLLKCTVNTNAGQTISLAGYVPIKSVPTEGCC